MRRLVIVSAILTLSMGCSESPTSPSSGASGLGGTWTGTVSDSSNGSGSMRVILTDLGTFGGITGVTGTWSTTFGEASKNGSGQATGTMSNGVLSLTLAASSRPICATNGPFSGLQGDYLATGLTVNDGRIRGAYLYGTCTGSADGALDLRKQ